MTCETGKISRGIGIFCTSVRLVQIDRVEPPKTSAKKCVKTRPQNRWIAKFGTSLWADRITPKIR